MTVGYLGTRMGRYCQLLPHFELDFFAVDLKRPQGARLRTTAVKLLLVAVVTIKLPGSS